MAKQSYFENCDKMTFAELRNYIDINLKKVSEGSLQQTESPTSRDEFLELWKLLQTKLKAPLILTGQPAAPIFPPEPIAPHPFPDFIPSVELAELNRHFVEIKSLLQAKQRDPEATKRSIKKLQFKKKIALQEHTKLWRKEFEHYLQLKNEYYAPHIEATSERKVAIKQIESIYQKYRNYRNELINKHATTIKERERFSKRTLRDIFTVFSNVIPIPVKKIRWRVLPPGDWSAKSIISHYENLQRTNPHVPYDITRIRSVLSLSPSKCYIGVDEFESYIVFGFQHSEKVALECPVYGNAIYVIRDNWQRLSRLSKQELLASHNNVVHRIIHTGDWFKKLKLELRKK